jgi:putative transcriptional regulator
MTESLRGRLLVASPVLSDGVFDRTVVLLLEHGPDEGSLGLVLNRPTTTDVVEVLPRWHPLAAPPRTVYWGGPVGAGSAIALGLARPGIEVPDWQPVTGRVGVIDLGDDEDRTGETVEAVRVFSGYAGWSPGQLESELAADAWWVMDADVLDVADPEPLDLWSAVLRRQGGRLARYANFPPDPSLN